MPRRSSFVPLHSHAPTAGPLASRVFASPRPMARRLWVALLAAALLACALGASVARADTIAVRSAEVRVEEDGYYLNAEFELSINPTLEEALHKGVPLYFLLEFELTRPRWYWFDDKILEYSTQYRVSYTPLTRQYRVASGLLGLTFDSIDEVQR